MLFHRCKLHCHLETPCWQWGRLGSGPGFLALWTCLPYFYIHPSTEPQADECHSETTGFLVALKNIQLWKRYTPWWQSQKCSLPLGNLAAPRRQYRHPPHLCEEARECWGASLQSMLLGTIGPGDQSVSLILVLLPLKTIKTTVGLTCVNSLLLLFTWWLLACHLAIGGQPQRSSHGISVASGGGVSEARSMFLVPISISLISSHPCNLEEPVSSCTPLVLGCA